MFKIAKVILPIAIEREFDYSLPEGTNVSIGTRVAVDFRGKKKTGLVVNLTANSQIKKIKPILDVLDDSPILNKEQIKFAKGLNKLYPYSLGDFLFMMIPAYLKGGRKVVFPDRPIITQGKSERSIRLFIKAPLFFQRYSIWGEMLENKLKEGSVLICLPQVSFLESAKKIIEKKTPHPITIIHSRQRESELFTNWRNCRKNALILGTRVSLFYYPSDLKLIILEEENSPYYFQEEKPFYHLWDAAIVLSDLKNIDIILSGDYPSLNSYKLIKEKKIFLKELPDERKIVKIVDNRTTDYKRKLLSPVLSELIRKNMEDRNRVVILCNRKGFGYMVSCSSCGYIYKCGHCSGFLIFSFEDRRGICPYCGKGKDIPVMCGECKSGYVKSRGQGIEKIEGIFKMVFPDVKIENWERMKQDTQIIISTSKILNSLYPVREYPVACHGVIPYSNTGSSHINGITPQAGNTPCEFSNGIYTEEKFDTGFLLDVDFLFSHLDYEATFNTFIYIEKLSLLFKKAFYIFTKNKEHYLFKSLNLGWQDFYEEELKLRKDLYLPPYGYLAKIVLRGENENKLFSKVESLYDRLGKKELEIYGPFKGEPFKLRDKFRYVIIVKSKKRTSLQKIIKEEVGLLRSSSLQAAVIIK